MTYPRPPYLDAGTLTEKAQILFSKTEADIPKFKTPITPLENFRRVTARQDPLWVPNSMSDFQNLMLQDLGIGRQIGAQFGCEATEDYIYHDWFGVSMTWCCSAGGATNTPGVCLLEDITNWEKVVKFPVLSDWDWQTKADDFMKNRYDPSKVLQIDISWGCIQRLIGVLGGYTEGMLAMALEPEAVRAFFDRFAEHMIEVIDLLFSLYPVNLMTLHDDWGTEKNVFFSPEMMEQMVFEPTKRIIDHIKSKNCAFTLHSCGNITRFIPYMIDMGADFLQIQRRAVDIPAMKETYGDRIGFNTGIEGMVPDKRYTKEDIENIVRHTIDIYGKGGGFYANIFDRNPEALWDTIVALYAGSREFYDAQRNRS